MKKLKIYLISQSVNCEYDTYDRAVVCAESEEEAKCISPSRYYKWHDGSWYFQYSGGTERREDNLTYFDWCLPEYVAVEYLGTADKSIKKGVICASYNAG